MGGWLGRRFVLAVGGGRALGKVGVCGGEARGAVPVVHAATGSHSSQVSRFDVMDDFKDFFSDSANRRKIYSPKPGAQLVETHAVTIVGCGRRRRACSFARCARARVHVCACMGARPCAGCINLYRRRANLSPAPPRLVGGHRCLFGLAAANASPSHSPPSPTHFPTGHARPRSQLRHPQLQLAVPQLVGRAVRGQGPVQGGV